MLLCDNTPNGVVQFLRLYADDGCVTDLTVGGKPYSVMGLVAPCTGDQTDGCDTTTPVATVGLCLPDGTPLAVILQRDCDGVVSAPGWVNLATGVYTDGATPAGAAPCDQSIAAARTNGRVVLCDCAPNGECVGFLRAIAADGSVVDTTMDGVAYVPSGTVGACDALYATERAATGDSAGRIVLCDCPPVGDCVSFLRAIAADGSVVDTTVAGLPYTPTGTVSSCEAVTASIPPCESPTTPVATTGLCLADGTPIATVASRDCDGVVTQDGWLNLRTGTYTAGPPPAGVMACGTGQSIQVTGVFCDVDPTTGDVHALVLVEYTYDDTGSISGVRLVRAADGTTYTLQGELTMCPTGGGGTDVETELLCVTDTNGVRVGQVLAEYGYHGTTGARLFTRYLDPTTGAVVTPPAGATVHECVAPCCPEPICYAGSGPGEMCQPGVLQELPTLNPTITSASVVANPNALTVNALGSSHNGTTTGDWTTVTPLDAQGAAPGLVLRYNFGGPADIAQIRLFNNYGSDLNDLDGIGSATLTVFDATDTVLWTGPLNAGNGATPFDTPFGGLLADATHFTLSDIVRQPTSNVTQLGWREIQGIGSYRALITWECPDETISALVDGPLPGITYDGANIVQTNGPHTFTFSSSAGAFEATLVTDNPGAWTSTQVTTDDPVTVLSASASLTVEAVPELARGIASGLLHPDGTVTDTNTGETLVDPVIVPCVAVREPDHVQTAHILDLCEAGHPFLRQVRVTRDANVQVIDTEIDGRTPYVVVNEAAVTAGPCVRERLGEVCTEAGPLLAPSSAVGFAQEGDCWVTTAASPDLTYTGAVDSLELTVEGGLAGGPSFRLILDGSTTLLGSHFSPPIPAFPTAIDTYHGTATVGGITVTADIVDGALALANDFSGEFGLAGRMRFAFSPQLTSVEINTSWGNNPALQLCDVVILPSTAPRPTQLVAFRSGDGTVTYYAADGTEVDSPVLLPCGTCCNGDTAPFAAATASAPSPVRARARTVTAAEGAWTPDEVTGVVTAVAATGVSGTWSVTDADGTVAAGLTASTAVRWDADGGELVPPAAITADADSTVAVTWTQR